MTGHHRHPSPSVRARGGRVHLARAGLAVTGAAAAFVLAACGSGGTTAGADGAATSGSTAAGGSSISSLEPAHHATVTGPFTPKGRAREGPGAGAPSG
jgi:hypothetical protein